jgi:hypothetical protein
MTDRQLAIAWSMITIFSQVALLPLLVLSTSGRWVGWLICYIASSAVALDPDCLTSPCLFPPLSPPSCRCSHLSPPTLPARFALLDPTSLRRGRLDRQISLALPSHTTPEECDAEPGIVPTSNISRPMAKIPRDDRVRILPCCALETHDASTPGSERALGARVPNSRFSSFSGPKLD